MDLERSRDLKTVF